MDTELARTFLTVVAAGNFIKAAARLHVTQSTVSARIRLLEEHLGCTLFVRNKGGTTLTPSGRLFQRHAAALVRTIEQARQEVGIPPSYESTLTVGGRFGLWEELMLEWLPWMRRRAPGIALRAEIGFEEDLMERLVEGSMDLAVMYTPQSRPGLTVEPLLEEQLILVSTDQDVPDSDNEYTYVDWGPEFFAKHSLSFPETAAAPLTVNIGWLGLQHILRHGGSGYFPKRLVRSYLNSGQLARVPEAPTFSLPAYSVHLAETDSDVIDLALEGIRHVLGRMQTP
ncbi:MAG TPA: LysR family transcriptional regulator [Arenicellales bacterium]|nr:LysR family transcriptional regulator [Arenicellales bacterium]